jgi:hypothetical protein
MNQAGCLSVRGSSDRIVFGLIEVEEGIEVRFVGVIEMRHVDAQWDGISGGGGTLSKGAQLSDA